MGNCTSTKDSADTGSSPKAADDHRRRALSSPSQPSPPPQLLPTREGAPTGCERGEDKGRHEEMFDDLNSNRSVGGIETDKQREYKGRLSTRPKGNPNHSCRSPPGSGGSRGRLVGPRGSLASKNDDRALSPTSGPVTPSVPAPPCTQFPTHSKTGSIVPAASGEDLADISFRSYTSTGADGAANGVSTFAAPRSFRASTSGANVAAGFGTLAIAAVNPTALFSDHGSDGDSDHAGDPPTFNETQPDRGLHIPGKGEAGTQVLRRTKQRQVGGLGGSMSTTAAASTSLGGGHSRKASGSLHVQVPSGTASPAMLSPKGGALAAPTPPIGMELVALCEDFEDEDPDEALESYQQNVGGASYRQQLVAAAVTDEDAEFALSLGRGTAAGLMATANPSVSLNPSPGGQQPGPDSSPLITQAAQSPSGVGPPSYGSTSHGLSASNYSGTNYVGSWLDEQVETRVRRSPAASSTVHSATTVQGMNVSIGSIRRCDGARMAKQISTTSAPATSIASNSGHSYSFTHESIPSPNAKQSPKHFSSKTQSQRLADVLEQSTIPSPTTSRPPTQRNVQDSGVTSETAILSVSTPEAERNSGGASAAVTSSNKNQQRSPKPRSQQDVDVSRTSSHSTRSKTSRSPQPRPSSPRLAQGAEAAGSITPTSSSSGGRDIGSSFDQMPLPRALTSATSPSQGSTSLGVHVNDTFSSRDGGSSFSGEDQRVMASLPPAAIATTGAKVLSGDKAVATSRERPAGGGASLANPNNWHLASGLAFDEVDLGVVDDDDGDAEGQ